MIGKGDAVQRLCGNLQVDISKSRTLLGWNPPISGDEGLRRVVVGISELDPAVAGHAYTWLRPRQEYGVETRGRLTIGNNVSN